jgi:hypothetical protein
MPERPRKPRRAQLRAWNWVTALASAKTGDDALSDMWRWLRSEVNNLADHRPEAAEAARWHAARQIAVIASQLPQAKIALRPGVTDAEQAGLLDPWKKKGAPGER